MTIPSDSLARGLDLFESMLDGRDELRSEFRRSRYEFFGGGPDSKGRAEPRLASRRHAEWFFLERYSAHLAGVPAEILADAWSELAEENNLEVIDALRGSSVGIFQVTGVNAGQGIWVRDLAGIGEYPINEPEGSRVLQKDDLLIGRIFPVGESLYRISPAAAHFRNADLLGALTEDLERLRAQRRGVLRLGQSELERMFWADRRAAASQGDESVEELRLLLAEARLSAQEIDAIFEHLARTPFDPQQPTSGGALGATLDQLAFETNVDLEAARRAMLAAWPVLADEPSSAPAAAPERTQPPATDVASAMAAFDADRERGEDLEQCFDRLERELGLNDESSDEGEISHPDFPGVVGAMVEEFLWEVGREKSDAAADDLAILRRFSRFAAGIGVFENLGARDLLTFATYWLPENGELRNAEEAHRMLGALRAFCRWAEASQEVRLESAFGETLQALGSSLPRLAEANRRRAESAHDDTGELLELTDLVGGREVRVTDKSGAVHEASIDSDLATWLRPADLLRGRVRPDGTLAVYCAYPPEAARLQQAS